MAALIDWLKYAGARKVDGTPVSSGRAYFYQPGTVSTQVTVYSDKDGLVALVQPVALDAAGRAVVYTKTPVKVEVQQAVDFAVVAAEDRANTVNAKQVEIENANYMGTSLVDGTQVLGGRTDLDTILTSIVGVGVYKENSASSERTYNAAIGDHITLQDHGAVGDDITDDTVAIAAAVARAIASNKPLRIEPGTYRFVGPIAVTLPAAAGLRIIGANQAACILKNISGTGNGITVDMGGAMESGIEMSDFTITNSGSSSGKAIEFVNGDAPSLRRITVALHRMGFDLSAVSHAQLEHCLVSSTDGNAAGRGFRLGAGAIAAHCRVTTATLGKAFVVEGAGASLSACRAASAATGYEFNASGLAHYCRSTSIATAFTMLASDAVCSSCVATGATVGFNVGAVSRSGCINCVSTDGTSDFTTSASAATPHDIGNIFTTRTQGEGNIQNGTGTRPSVSKKFVQSFNSAVPSWTPDLTKPAEYLVCYVTNAGASNLTINATATAGLVDGQRLKLVIESNLGGGGSLSFSWNAQYKGGGAWATSIAATAYQVVTFLWRAASNQWICEAEFRPGNYTAGGPFWST